MKKKKIFIYLILHLMLLSQKAFPMTANITEKPQKENYAIEQPIQKKIGRFTVRNISPKTEPWVSQEPPFSQWCNFLKENWPDKSKQDDYIHEEKMINKYLEIQKILDKYIEINKDYLKDESLWFNTYPEKSLTKIDFDITKISPNNFLKKIKKPITPHAQKLIVSQNSHAFVFGDIHGNFDALQKLIKNLIDKNVLDNNLKLKPNNYFIFLGDYVDRGQQGVEVLLTLFSLKIKNPKKVILIRGNHENITMNNAFGLSEEIKNKFSMLKQKEYKINLLSILLSYEFMPATVFLGYESEQKPIKFIELSHGAIDHRYNPKEFLDSNLPENVSIQFSEIELENFIDFKPIVEGEFINESKNILTDIPKDKTVNLSWGDIDYDSGEKKAKISKSPRGAIAKYNPIFIKKYFENINTDKSKICKLIRGHQHNLPLEIRGNTFNNKIGAVLVDNIAYTVMSGIYTTPELNFDWYNFNYYPTFLELTPSVFAKASPDTPTDYPADGWKIKIKYLKDGKEITEEDIKDENNEKEQKAATKIQSFFRGYKIRKKLERKKLDLKIDKLNINPDFDINKITTLIEEITLTDKNNDSRTELAKLITQENLFGDDNQDFAEYILKLKLTANYKNYLNTKLTTLLKNKIAEIVYQTCQSKRPPPPPPSQ